MEQGNECGISEILFNYSFQAMENIGPFHLNTQKLIMIMVLLALYEV